MNRIDKLFKRKKNKVFSVYCTAGFPKYNDTLTILRAMETSGVDMIELGMPYSDPLADGPVIQHSSTIALHNGMTIKKLFEQLKHLREPSSTLGVGNDIPILLMGYMNPILQYGFELFCAHAAAVGIDGLILPDLPEHEFETEYGAIIKAHGLDFVFLVTPETSQARLKKLDALSTGFLYAVSSSSTTGKDKNMDDVKKYLQKLEKSQLRNPVIVGFGIKDKQTFESACEFANGAIIGTAFIKALEHSSDVASATKEFVGTIVP